MNYWIDVLDSNGNKLGDGAITSVTNWKSITKLDSAGKFSFSVPANDPRSKAILPKRIVKCYTRVLNSIQEIGSGIIDKISPVGDSAGNFTLEVEGSDLLRELTYRSVGFLNLSDSEGNGVNNAISTIMSFAPTGWSIDSSVGQTEPLTNVYGGFSGENILNALIRISENKGEHFRISTGRKIAWLGTNLTSSGIRAIQDGDPINIEGNDNVAIIKNITEEQDTYSVITRLYPYGSGVGDARLTLVSTTRTVPAGFTLDKTNNCLININAEATFGRIDKFISFKEISPISNTDNDLENASNVLFDQAFNYLKRYSKAEKFYKLEVIKLNKLIYPGQTIRVVFKKIIDGDIVFSIDKDLYILESTNVIDSSGIRTSEIKVATIDRFPENNLSYIYSQLEQGEVYSTHPQLAANLYTLSYEKYLDNSKNVNLDFWLGREMLNVNGVILRFRIDPLRSTVKSVAGQSSTSSSGGGGGGTSSSGGGTSTTSGGSLGSHFHWLSVPYTGGTFATDSSNQYHTHSVSIGSHSHSFSIGSHTHSVTPVINTVYGIFEESSANTLTEADFIYSVNGSDALGRAVSINNGWYELDITSLVSNPLNYRPLQESNRLTISTATAKTCTITAHIFVRSTIQAIAVY